jgi:hypothetical protein
MLSQSRARIVALINTLVAVCKAASNPVLPSSLVTPSVAQAASTGRDPTNAFDRYSIAAKNAADDERIGVELKASLALKRQRRFVEALEIWNRLADEGVFRAMRELLTFYLTVDYDPTKVMALCAKFREMGVAQVDSRWLDLAEQVVECRRAGNPAPSPLQRFPAIWTWKRSNLQPGEIDEHASRYRGRIMRHHKRSR